ncbi:hypothetical protein FKW77_004641 [Venturia effusa]|uniref:Uncharacterized protein n=1 Tax=Venturia effusa TaxID=50376 RepID=A0A517LK29_9PEZI|nr:hypothetical protein FKW77_004641 [Venturia effusa]
MRHGPDEADLCKISPQECSHAPCHQFISFPAQGPQAETAIQEDGMTTMEYYMNEPASEYGLAFVRSDTEAILSAKTYETGLEQVDQDLAHVGAHLETDMDINMVVNIDEDIIVGNEQAGMDPRTEQ